MGRIDYTSEKVRDSRKVTVVLVAFIFFLDFTLQTAIVPIMPHFLYTEGVESSTVMDLLVQTTSTKEYRELSLNSSDIETDLGNLNKTTNANQENSSTVLQDTLRIGLMLASKPLLQLTAIPLTGMAMSMIHVNTVLLGGLLMLFLSSFIFAAGNSYAVLFFARALQGIASASSNLAGMTILAEIYTDQEERTVSMSRAISGIALGTLFGPVYGGMMYELFGKTLPFMLLAALALAGAVGITIPNLALTLLEAVLPSWMMETMNATAWQQGTIFLPDCICYLICTYYIGSLGRYFGRWLVSMMGFLLLGSSFILLPFSHHVLGTVFPMLILGFSLGLTDGILLPELGYLADIRHAAIYGAVFALEEIVVCLGYMIGPVLGGFLINSCGFQWTCFSIAIICFGFAPFLYFLKNPSSKEENMVLVEHK